jgi:hypothetical protein
MFCPHCLAEYREGYLACSTCEVDLVEDERPDVEEAQWTPDTPIGARGTRLIFLYMAQICFVVLAALLQPQPLVITAALLGAASVVAIFMRKPFAPHLIYSYLALLLLYGAADVLTTTQAVAGLIGTVVGGILLPLLWFGYFYRRAGLFADESSPIF